MLFKGRKDVTMAAEGDGQAMPQRIDGYSPKTETLFVHLCSGEIVEVRDVSAHRVAEHNVVIEHNSGEVTVFPRREVYFISDGQISPPAMH